MILTRRKFFSFFGTGVAMLAKPDLFVPKGAGKITVKLVGPPVIHTVWYFDLRKEFLSIYEEQYRKHSKEILSAWEVEVLPCEVIKVTG